MGMKIVRDRKAKKIWLSQEKYVEWVLEKFNMRDAKCNILNSSIRAFW